MFDRCLSQVDGPSPQVGTFHRSMGSLQVDGPVPVDGWNLVGAGGFEPPCLSGRWVFRIVVIVIVIFNLRAIRENVGNR